MFYLAGLALTLPKVVENLANKDVKPREVPPNKIALLYAEINENTKDTLVLFFDCEWSAGDNGIGLIQIATDVSKRKVIIVDCTKASLEQIIKKFFNLMNDIKN